MCRLTEGKCVSTETCGGKLTPWGDVEDDEMYAYVELTQIIFTRPKLIELGGSGDKNWRLPMRKSLFAHVPPYIIFQLYSMNTSCELPPQITKHLSWRYGARVIPQMVRRTLIKSGFKIGKQNDNWMGLWGAPMTTAQMKALKLFQKINHFPGILYLSHKDWLWRNVNKMIRRFGISEYSFTPMTYVFPEDTKKFRKFFERHGGTWITKPPTGCSGIGIRVVSRWCDIPKRCDLVVQRYIKPRLIQGVKFDMRLYVLITSVDPLLIYFYSEGLVRFATAKYVDDVSFLHDKYMHLTNTSVNKTSPMFKSNDSVNKCQGNMWSLNSLWSYLGSKQRVDVSKIWTKIRDIVIKTVISAEVTIVKMSESSLPSNYNAYQLLGFDIMLDQNLKPWLLEVNHYPSMDPDTPLCAIVKGQLARDLLNIVGFQIPKVMSVIDEEYLISKYDQYPLCQDSRLQSTTLTTAEQDKHNQFANVGVRDDYLLPILDSLTPDDVRHLIRYEDEMVQVGNFEKIFPTRNTHTYHKFLDKVRYYNKLLDAWEDMYGSRKTEGISRLQKLCKNKFHLSSVELVP